MAKKALVEEMLPHEIHILNKNYWGPSWKAPLHPFQCMIWFFILSRLDLCIAIAQCRCFNLFKDSTIWLWSFVYFRSAQGTNLWSTGQLHPGICSIDKIWHYLQEKESIATNVLFVVIFVFVFLFLFVFVFVFSVCSFHWACLAEWPPPSPPASVLSTLPSSFYLLSLSFLLALSSQLCVQPMLITFKQICIKECMYCIA